MEINKYQSISQFCAALENNGWVAPVQGWAFTHDMQAPGHEAAKAYVLNGCDAKEPALIEAIGLYNKIANTIKREHKEQQPSVVGGRVRVVPAIHGHPKSMLRPVETETVKGRVRIVVDVASSAMYSKAELGRRGAACAALVGLLGQTRQVELYVCWANKDGQGSAALVKVNTSPINMAHIVAVIAMPEFSRGLRFEYVAGAGRTRRWPNGCVGAPAGAVESDAARIAYLRNLFDLEPTDIILPRLSGEMGDSQMQLTNPIGWVNKMLKEQE